MIITCYEEGNQNQITGYNDKSQEEFKVYKGKEL